MSNEANIDVKAAIEKNSFMTSTAELERRGKRQVKVIKTSLIFDLIHQAVENVQRESGRVFNEEEREKLVQESKAEFDRLLHDQQNQRQEIQALHDQIRGYEKAITEMNHKTAAQVGGLEEENQRLRVEVERLSSGETGPGGGSEEAEELRSKIHGLEEALKLARNVAAEREQQLTQAREQFEQENASRDENAGHLHEMIRRREAEAEGATKARAENEEYRLQIAGLTAELKAMRENQPAAQSLLNELKAMREDVKALEARNRELETQAASAPRGQAAPAGDMSALEKLFADKMAQISSEISAKLANVGRGGGEVLGTSPEDIKLTIQKIFSDEIDGKVDSNIGEIEVKETTSGGIASNLERLKNLGLKSKD